MPDNFNVHEFKALAQKVAELLLAVSLVSDDERAVVKCDESFQFVFAENNAVALAQMAAVFEVCFIGFTIRNSRED